MKTVSGRQVVDPGTGWNVGSLRKIGRGWGSWSVPRRRDFGATVGVGLSLAHEPMEAERPGGGRPEGEVTACVRRIPARSAAARVSPIPQTERTHVAAPLVSREPSSDAAEPLMLRAARSKRPPCESFRAIALLLRRRARVLRVLFGDEAGERSVRLLMLHIRTPQPHPSVSQGRARIADRKAP